MILRILLLLLLSIQAIAHPGIAIVKNSKGTIYYSDLQQVWQIKNGTKTIAVPEVHTHELYMDHQDNLYGQHEFNPNDTTFYHYLWRLSPDGKLDTVVNTQLAYQQIDFSLARDKWGNEYYTKQFIKQRDTAHIYKKTPDGKETIFAKGEFKGVSWLHPQHDGSLLFVRHNQVYRATPNGEVKIVAQNIGNAQPSFHFSGNSITVWGVWQDATQNIYVAVFSDQMVKKISPDGKVSNYYQSKGDWAPTHGVFDDNGQLWLLECSDKNEIRVIKAAPLVINKEKKNLSFIYIGATIFIAAILGLIFIQRKSKNNHYRMQESV